MRPLRIITRWRAADRASRRSAWKKKGLDPVRVENAKRLFNSKGPALDRLLKKIEREYYYLAWETLHKKSETEHDLEILKRRKDILLRKAELEMRRNKSPTKTWDEMNVLKTRIDSVQDHLIYYTSKLNLIRTQVEHPFILENVLDVLEIPESQKIKIESKLTASYLPALIPLITSSPRMSQKRNALMKELTPLLGKKSRRFIELYRDLAAKTARVNNVPAP